MPSKGTGHMKTKKHCALNQANYNRHKGKAKSTLADLKVQKDKQMYTDHDYKTKKELKEAVANGKQVRVHQPGGIFPGATW